MIMTRGVANGRHEGGILVEVRWQVAAVDSVVVEFAGAAQIVVRMEGRYCCDGGLGSSGTFVAVVVTVQY
jgi:hypothetical protein